MANNAPIGGLPIFVVGNKKDLVESKEVTLEEGEEFSKKNGAYFLETSALDNSDSMIEQVFSRLTSDIIGRKKKEEQHRIGIIESEQIQISKDQAGTKKKGCS